ncbi:MAG: TldD/PmbA family protein [Oscillospiraceae bacterium]|nr:TldD/PmbA family protein [Oscillospiraceae bacterium]
MDKLINFGSQLLERALQRGFADAEVAIDSGESQSIQILKGEIDKYQNSQSRRVSFRGTYQGKMGQAGSEWIDEAAIDIILDEAMGNAAVIEEEEQHTLFRDFVGENYLEVDGFRPALAEVSTETRIAAALQMEKTVLGSAEVVASDWCGTSYGEGSTLLMNTYGLKLTHRSNGAGGHVSARAVRGGQTKTGGEGWNGKDWSDFDPVKIGEKAVYETVSLLGAKQVASGTYNIVLRNDAFASMLGRYSSVFLADRAQKGLSLLAGREGETIAAECFTLMDSPHYKDKEVPFDSEGVATYDKAIVEKGVFKTFLHNRKTAAKDGVKSTGNAGGRGSIGVTPMNMNVMPGTQSLDQMLSQMGDGLLITDVEGAGSNPISGDFSLIAEGFVVTGGKRGQPVEQITIAGNFFEFLKNIAAVGSDLREDCLSPSVLVKGVSVAGS